jgi:hypothetical protein
MTVASASRALSSATGARLGAETTNQWAWLAGGAAFAFLVPFVFADVIAVPRDLYYAIYSLSVFALFVAWIRSSGLELREFFARNWRWAVLLGVVSGGALAAIVFKGAATSHPHGGTLAAEIFWRGVVYGAADGILLGAFPVLAVFAAIPFRRGREHWLRTAATGLLALAMAFGYTAVYHAGYPDFRSGKMSAPMRGTAFWTAPTLLTLNPVGAPIAHITLHVSAVIHSYRTETFLPPH